VFEQIYMIKMKALQMWHLQICNKKYNVTKNTKCGVLATLQMWCTTIIVHTKILWTIMWTNCKIWHNKNTTE